MTERIQLRRTKGWRMAMLMMLWLVHRSPLSRTSPNRMRRWA